jgi:hypothetical protein
VKIIFCGLSIVIWHNDLDSRLDDFRKKSSFPLGKFALLPNLTLSPTSLHPKATMKVIGYWWKYAELSKAFSLEKKMPRNPDSKSPNDLTRSETSPS